MCNCNNTTTTLCQEPVSCSCQVLLKSSCVNNVDVDLECSNILKGQTLSEVLTQLDAYICTKFDSITNFFELINLGTGSQIYKGVSMLGKKEFRTLVDSGLINLVQGANDITISVDEVALTAFIGSSYNTPKYKLLPSNFNFTAIPSGYDNTTWIIRYDFDLDNESITLPENVTLSFEGGSITNGSIVLDNTTIDCKNIESVLTDVVLTGTVTNTSLDVRLFGILPNNNLIDTTVIYNTNLVGLDVTLKFPKGNYYLSELHVTKNFFQIEGEESNDLEVRTVFHPFNDSQYYIIKIGGTKFTLNNAASAWAKNSSIMHIWFTTPLDFTGLNLTSPDAAITNLAYQCSALILDKAQGGRYAINGHTIHNMPLLSIGQSYELYFDYIKMYANHGKSDLPIVQVTNNFQTGGYISATVIHQLWVESMVGSVFATSGLAGINELIINNVFIEGTIEWEQESIFTENRFTRLTKSLPSYYSTVENVIPMFSVGGVANITIGSMYINGTDTEWQNSLDPVPLGWNTRSFFKVDIVSSDIKIGSLSDGTYSQNMLLEGTSSVAYRNTFRINNSSPEIAYYNQVADNFDFISGTNNIKPVKLKSNYEYVNDDLSFLLEAKFLTNIGLDNHFTTPDEPAYTKAIQTRWDNYILNQSGFYIEDDNIKIVGKTSSGNNIIDIEYYDVDDTLLSTQTYSTSVIPNILFKNTIALTKPVGYSYLKLVNANSGYFLNTYSLTTLKTLNVLSGALTNERVPVATGLNTVKDGIIYDNGSNIAIATTGNPYLNFLNLTNSEFLNVGLTSTESIINSSRGIDFITNNSTTPLKLDGTNVNVWYEPTTSASTYDILTRNASTGVIEKKPSNFYQQALSLTSGIIPVSSGGTGLVNSILSDNGSGISIYTATTPYLSITNETNFLNSGINESTSFINSSRGIDFVTDNSTIPLRLVGENVGLIYSPTTSISGFEVLTRNTVNGVVEKKSSSFFQKALTNYTVATLPTGTVGDTAYVTDATAPTYLGTLTGGGTVITPVFYNGTAWVAY